MKRLILLFLSVSSFYCYAQTSNSELNKIIKKYILIGCDSNYSYTWDSFENNKAFNTCHCTVYKWKDLSYSLKQNSLTEEDSLNGYAFKGTIIINPGLYMYYHYRSNDGLVEVESTKSEWKKAENPFYINVYKKNNQWYYSQSAPNWVIMPLKETTPSCTDIKFIKGADKNKGFKTL